MVLACINQVVQLSSTYPLAAIGTGLLETCTHLMTYDVQQLWSSFVSTAQDVAQSILHLWLLVAAPAAAGCNYLCCLN
jgi:hypothetical protein